MVVSEKRVSLSFQVHEYFKNRYLYSLNNPVVTTPYSSL